MLIEEASQPAGLLVGFHGYGQAAEDMLEQLRLIPGAESWTRVSIQALHPFYTRGDARVVASWMTRQDRELASDDNTRYACDVIDTIATDAPLFLAGFSQGAAMAYRAAARSRRPVAGIVALAGDIPPELKTDPSVRWPRVLVGVGDREEWYAGEKLEADLRFLRDHRVTHELVRFAGGHEWTTDFRRAVGAWISRHAGA